MSSRAESRTASQFVSLTMKLKDKLHRHTQRHKVSALQLQEDTLQHKSGCVLLDQQRVVVSSLQYFKVLVDRLGLDKQVLDQSVVGGLLAGASNGLLEAVQTLVQLEPGLKDSKTVSSCLTGLYQSLAQLIGWADHVILQREQPAAGITAAIRAVLDGVKDLVRLAGQATEGSAPLSPVQSPPAAREMGGLDQQETLAWKPVEGEEPMVSPPPKPNLPLPQGLSPPALPPKRRQSLGPAPCRVAIVAPMRREPEVDTQECEEAEALKQRSSSSAEPAADVTHCDWDPDYDFLHKDMSFWDALPPPSLPEKRRRSAAGPSLPSVSPGSEPEQDPAPCDDVTDTKTPPPLPEKKRHIHQYLQFCSSYDAESAAIFYQTPPTFRQPEVDPSVQLMNTHLDADSAPSPEPPAAPALPPKKKQKDHQDSAQELHTTAALSCRTEEEDKEEEEEEVLLLTNRQQILRRIVMKTQEEEGPDVKAASPEILLVYATEMDSSTEADPYCEAFLSTYRTFISPDDVIRKLQHRFRSLRDRQEVADRTFTLLRRVVDELCVMELHSDLLLLLTDLVSWHLIGGELGKAHQLRSSILSKVEQKRRSNSILSLRPLAARGVAARPGSLLDFRSQDLAEQLTVMDSELFYKIELPEVLLWSKEQNEEMSPNLTEFTQHFNNVSFWVRSLIILQDKPQDREKLLLKFLKVMKHLRKLNNFNSFLSILSALDSAPLRRLDWQKNTAETLEEFGSLIDSSSSFRAYRAALADVEPPCIPYLGLILQDLTFVHLGNPDTVMTSEGSKVNFSKRWQQFNILYTLRNYQQVPYALQPNDDVILFFNGFGDHLAEEALWDLSLRLRPRNAPRNNQK